LSSGKQPAQRGLKLRKLAVDMNPESLKRACCRVLARLAGFDDLAHELGQFAGSLKGAPCRAASHKRLCNRASKPFFTEFTNHLRKFALRGAGQESGGRFAPRGIHAHVQRTVGTEGKAPLGGVDLRAGDTDVEQQAVQRRQLQRAQFAEACVADLETRVLDGARHGDRLGVAVQRDQASLRPEARQQQAAVTAAAEGAVQVGPVQVGLGVQQRVHRLVQQHGDMRPGRCGGG
jgi:hypothetical protein